MTAGKSSTCHNRTTDTETSFMHIHWLGLTDDELVKNAFDERHDFNGSPHSISFIE